MITLVMGAMFSGKSTELIRLLERSYIAGKKTILLRPHFDTRDFLSHSKKDTAWLKEERTDLATFNSFDYNVIGIDEGQFHVELAKHCLFFSFLGKDVIVSALHASSESEMFPEIIKLIPHCDNILKLNAVCCICGSDYGSYTFYKEGGKTNQAEVGGADKYDARCRNCYYGKNILVKGMK